MRISRQIVVTIRLFASLFVFAAVLAVSHAQEPTDRMATVRAGRRTYGVLDVSPNGRYALVWGSHKHQIDFARFSEDEAYQNSVLSYDPTDDDVVDAIVDRRLNRLIVRISGCHHVPRLNHSIIKATWSPNGKYVLVYWDDKWEPFGIYIVTLGDTNSGTVADVLPQLERVLASKLSIVNNRVPNFSYREFDCDFSIDASNHLTDVVSISPRKAEPGWNYDITLIFEPKRDGMPEMREPSIEGLVRSYETAVIDNNDEAGFTRSDAIAGFSNRGSILWRSIISTAVSKGTDQTYERSIIFDRFVGNGRSDVHADIYPAVRRDVLMQVRHFFPDVEMSKARPLVMATFPDELKNAHENADLLTFDVSVNPLAANQNWSYTAQISYHLALKYGQVVVERKAISLEKPDPTHKTNPVASQR